MFLSQKPVTGKLFASSVVYGLIPSKITQSLYHSYNKILLSPGTILFVFIMTVCMQYVLGWHLMIASLNKQGCLLYLEFRRYT